MDKFSKTLRLTATTPRTRPRLSGSRQYRTPAAPPAGATPDGRSGPLQKAGFHGEGRAGGQAALTDPQLAPQPGGSGVRGGRPECGQCRRGNSSGPSIDLGIPLSPRATAVPEPLVSANRNQNAARPSPILPLPARLPACSRPSSKPKRFLQAPKTPLPRPLPVPVNEAAFSSRERLFPSPS